MKTNYFPIIILLVVVLTGCSKEQRIVNKIEGKWSVTKAEITGVGELTPDLIFDFEHCKMNNQDFCDFSVHNFDLNQVTVGSYAISEDGESMLLSSLTGTNFTFDEYEIETLNNRKLRIRRVVPDLGEYQWFELQSIP